MRFKKCGQNVKIFDTAKIVFPENIELGNNVIIDDFVLIIAKKKIIIGDNVHIGSFTSISGNESLIMEDFSGLSAGVRVFTSSDDYTGGYLTNPTIPDTYKNVQHGAIVLKKHVIVGANSIILPGSFLEEGVAVGANSLVKGHLEEYTLYAGNPARKILQRDKENLLALEKRYKEENNA